MQSDVFYISTDSILPNLYQPRKYFDEESIDELAKSIKNYGIIQPLSVRKMSTDRFELVAGERRLRAAKKIGLQEVPVIIIDITDREAAVIALLENLQREDLNYIEEAEAYFNLIQDHYYTQEKLAECIGKKQSTIANKLRLLKLSPEIREILLENNLTERHARALLKLSDVEIQKKILKQVVDESLNVRRTEELVEKEILKMCKKEVAVSEKKKIKGAFNPKIYVNTIKQIFDKYGINANYKSKELDNSYEITVLIPKK